MVTFTQREITQGLFVLNCLASLVCGEWLTLGDYGYVYGDGYHGYDKSSSHSLPPRSRYDYNNNYYIPSYDYYGSHKKETYEQQGYKGSNDYRHERVRTSSTRRDNGGKHTEVYLNKDTDHKRDYGYEKHDYKYGNQHYGREDVDAVEHNGGNKKEHAEKGGHIGTKNSHKDEGYEHEKSSGHGREGSALHEGQKTTYNRGQEGQMSGYGGHGSGYGGDGHPYAKPLYGHCYNDFDCPMSQCCLKQSGISICTDLNSNTGACSRRRECRLQQDCPSNQCCFPRTATNTLTNNNLPNNLANTLALARLYFPALVYGNSYGYGSHGGSGGSGGHSGYGAYGRSRLYMDGLCQPAGMRGQPCMMLLQGVTARGCPCTTGLTCNIPSGSNVGTCQ